MFLETPGQDFINTRTVITAVVILALLTYILINIIAPGLLKNLRPQSLIKTPEELLKELPPPSSQSQKDAQTLLKKLPAPAKNNQQIELELLNKLPAPNPI